jgi:menaquinone-dependent protoporphyrinogen IX oxidase
VCFAGNLQKGEYLVKGIVLYKTSCGSTKEYAEWISEDTGFEAHPIAKAAELPLASYDVIIVGGYVMASKVVIGRWVASNWDQVKDKKVVVFSTSGAKPSPEVKKEFLEKSFPPEIANSIEYFPMHGRRRQQDLSLMGKTMMWVAKTFIAKDAQEKADMSKDFDGVDRKYVAPLAEYVKGLG